MAEEPSIFVIFAKQKIYYYHFNNLALWGGDFLGGKIRQLADSHF